MSCGIEHISNCHGEITGLLCLISAGSLWLRIKYNAVKDWFAIKRSKWQQKLKSEKEQ